MTSGVVHESVDHGRGYDVVAEYSGPRSKGLFDDDEAGLFVADDTNWKNRLAASGSKGGCSPLLPTTGSGIGPAESVQIAGAARAAARRLTHCEAVANRDAVSAWQARIAIPIASDEVQGARCAMVSRSPRPRACNEVELLQRFCAIAGGP